MALSGRLMSAIKDIVSKRAKSHPAGCSRESSSASRRGPVFIACNMSRASAPRTLTEHDAIRAHTKSVDHQLALPNGPLPSTLGDDTPFGRRAAAADCSSAESSNRHDSLAVGDETGEHVQ
jgi:hypothetical protein